MLRWIAIAILPIIFGCQTNTTIDAARMETDIKSVMDAQRDAWNRGDIESYMAGYWNSPDVLFASRGTFARGWQPLMDRYKAGYPDGQMGTLTFSGVEIYPITSETAWVVGQWALEMEGSSPKGAFTLIFLKKADGWRIIHDHSSGVPIEESD